ncbi:MAG: NAD(P)/FAD-dependent oxidoreductase [Flavobacteriaceae bacterium]|nr:NAD(P)/FAD-dependent oxidoreductase [Flavobacteriaceae bacterium]
MNIPASELKRIVIIGGGFAGINLAKSLKGQEVQIVMIDRNNYHTFQPLLYQVSTGGLEPDSIAYPIRKILKKLKDFHFRWAEVERIEPEKKTVVTNKGQVSYDYLVMATGTKTNYFGNESFKEYSMPMKSVPQALNIRSYMLQNFEKADDSTNQQERLSLLNFCIIGAGPTGVELAGAFAELKKNVFPRDYPHLNVAEMEIHLFEGTDRILPPMRPRSSKKSQEFLEKMGVTVHLNTMVESYDGTVLKTNQGDEFSSRNFIWTAGVTGAKIPGLPDEALLERFNRFKVNRFNQVKGFEEIFAIGDIAYMETEDFPEGHPQVAQPAIQQGKHLSSNFERLLAGREMEPFSYFDKGTMATIGRNKAVVDLPSRGSFSGTFAWLIWMFVHLMALVGFRNKVVVFFNWVYNYINYDKAARLIVRTYNRKGES